MSSNSTPTLGEAISAQVRGDRDETPHGPAIGRLLEESRPAGSVALDFTCDRHGGRLMRLWMSHQAGRPRFGAEGHKGAWDTDTSGRGTVLVTCTSQGCRNSALLTSEWLVARLGQVRANFEAGKGLPIAWFPLSQVGISRR